MIDFTKPIRFVNSQLECFFVSDKGRDENGFNYIIQTKNGLMFLAVNKNGTCQSNFDIYRIENIPEDKYVYINFYEYDLTTDKMLYHGLYDCKKDADASTYSYSGKRISCQKIKIEPGKYDK
jgi:hypothetical protein